MKYIELSGIHGKNFLLGIPDTHVVAVTPMKAESEEGIGYVDIAITGPYGDRIYSTSDSYDEVKAIIRMAFAND